MMKMKKIWGALLSLTLVLGFVLPVKASDPSLLVTVDKDTVNVGDTVTFTVSVSNGAGDVSVSGAASDYGWFENSSKTYTVTATEAGTITVSASGTISDLSEDPSDHTLSDSATVTVIDNTPKPPVDPEKPTNPTRPSTPSVPEEPEDPEEPEKSDDSRLYWLEVDKGTLTPEFSSYVYEYTVELTSKDKEITISADVWDNNASMSGTGLKVLEVGSNSFTIDVTAEDGSRTAYTINVNVKEVATIFFDFNDKKLGVLNEVANADIPKGFTEKTIQIKEEKVKAFENKEATLTLLYMVDEAENKGFYIYSEKDSEILGLYRPMIIDGKEYYPVNIPASVKNLAGLMAKTITLDDETLECLAIEGEHQEDLKQYAILYLMNTDGKIHYYAYDTETKKLKEYPETSPLTAKNLAEWLLEKEETPWLLYGGIAAGVVVIAGIGIFIFIKTKKKKEKALRNASVKENRKTKHRDRKLVTDDTFFQEVPFDEEEGAGDEEGIPSFIENALKGITEADVAETIVAKPKDTETTVDITKLDEDDQKDDDDDWIDENMIHSVVSDDTDLDLHFDDLFKDK